MRTTNWRAFAAALALPLAACQSASIATYAQDAQALAEGLLAVSAEFAQINGLSGAQLATLQRTLADAQTLAAAIATAGSASAAADSAIAFVNAINVALSLLVPLPLPQDVRLAVLSAQVLLPIFEAQFGILAPAPTAARPPLTPKQARAILSGLAAAK